MQKRGFTLIEITLALLVIAIISSVSFLSISKWLVSSRDVDRTTSFNIISNALKKYIYQNDEYPSPDDSALIVAGGLNNVVGYQGYVWTGLYNVLNISVKDPTDGTPFTYYTTATRNRFQLLGYFENQKFSSVDNVYALDYAKMNVGVYGDKLGVLVDANTKAPIQVSTKYLELSGSTTSYISYLTDKIYIQSVGMNLLSNMAVQNNSIARYDTGLVLASDMESSVISGNTAYMREWSNSNTKGTLLSGVNIGGVGGIYNRATKFDGIDDNIDLGNNPSLNFQNQDFSISVWLNIVALNSGGFDTIMWRSDPTYVARHLDYKNTTQELRFVHYNGHAAQLNSITWVPTLNIWYNITMIRKGTVFKIYVNGNKVGNDQTFNLDIDNLTANLYLGKRYPGDRFLNGSIDEVRIYNRALSDTEVKFLYDSYN